MNRHGWVAILVMAPAAFWLALPVQAEGFYVSGELGMNFGESLDVDGVRQ